MKIDISHTYILKAFLFITLDTYLNPLYLIANKINGYFEEIHRNKYLTLVPTNQSKDTLKSIYETKSEI